MTHVEIPRLEAEENSIDKESAETLPGPLRKGDPVIDWRRERWATRYNPVWARILAAWATMLAGDGSQPLRALGLKDGTGQDAVFRLSAITAWSRPSHDHDYFLRGGR
jgi:hypothetical protein